MSHFASAPPGAGELRLADGTIRNIATYRLPAFDWGDFQVVVDCEATDAISQALHQQAFRPPPGFRVLEDWGQPGRRVLDLGAHIGVFALLAAALGCQVAAVEADPTNCALLQASVQRNGFAHFQVIAAHYEQLTVDDLLAQLGWPQVDLIRIAWAGAEGQAMAGMTQLLQQAAAPPLLLTVDGNALAQYGETPQHLLASLAEYGYRCYRAEPTTWRLTPANVPQWPCVAHYLALKATPHPPHWRFLPPLTQQEMVEEIHSQARQPADQWRAYVGQMLALAEPAILHERSVIRTLQTLQADPHPAVRAAVAWWKLADMPLAVRMADRMARLRTKKP